MNFSKISINQIKFLAQKTAVFYSMPETCTSKNIWPESMTHMSESGTKFLAPTSEAAFWLVCHGHKVKCTTVSQ